MKILLAVDGSEHSKTAEVLLSRVRGRAAHDVDVLYVSPVVQKSPDAGEKSITAVLKENGRRMAASVAQSLARGGVRARGTVAESHDVADAILSRAERAPRPSLIVLGARGHTPLKTFFLGSVSQKVSRHATTAVLVARMIPRGRALKALIAVDGSAAGRRLPDFLARLGVPSSSELTLAHVVSDPLAFWVPEAGWPSGYSDSASYAEASKALRARGRRVLDEARALFVARGFHRLRTRLLEGHPAGELLAAVERSRPDLVVLGRRGLSKLDRFFLGSVSQKVSSYTTRSVLIVP